MSQKRIDPKENVGKGFLEKGLGLVGDSHAGTEKEVGLLAIESIHKLCQETGISAGPGSFAENITSEGMNLTSLPIGSKLQVGEAKLMVIQIGKDASQAQLTTIRDIPFYRQKACFVRLSKVERLKLGILLDQ